MEEDSTSNVANSARSSGTSLGESCSDDVVVKTEPVGEDDSRSQSESHSQSSDYTSYSMKQRQFVTGVASTVDQPFSGVGQPVKTEVEEKGGGEGKGQKTSAAETEYYNLPVFWDSTMMPDLSFDADDSTTRRSTRTRKAHNFKELEEGEGLGEDGKAWTGQRSKNSRRRPKSRKKRTPGSCEESAETKTRKSTYTRNKRANMSEEERAAYRAKDAERKRLRRLRMSETERKAYDADRKREYMRRKRENWSDEQKSEFRAREAERKRMQRAQMSEEQKQEERFKCAIRARLRRSALTADDKVLENLRLARKRRESRASRSSDKNGDESDSLDTSMDSLDFYASLGLDDWPDQPLSDKELVERAMASMAKHEGKALLGREESQLGGGDTDEDSLTYKERERERMRKYRATLSEDDKVKIRALRKEHMRSRRMKMSEDQKERERQRCRDRIRRKRASLSKEDRDLARLRNTQAKRLRRAELRALGVAEPAKKPDPERRRQEETLNPCFSCHRFLHKRVMQLFKREKYKCVPQERIDVIAEYFTTATGLEMKYVCKTCSDSLSMNLMPRKSPAFPFASALATERLLNDCKLPVTGAQLSQMGMTEDDTWAHSTSNVPGDDDGSRQENNSTDIDGTADNNRSDTTMTTLYVCQQCGEKFLNSKSLGAHMFVHTGVILNSRQFVCRVCGEECGDGVSYNDHIQLNHREQCTALCEICGRCFFHAQSLTMHMKRHTDARTYCCDECGASYKFASQLSAHLRTHRNEKPYTCSVCQKCFSHANSLSLHMRVHTNERPYSCKACNKTFKYYGQMSMHNKRNHNPNKPPKQPRKKKSDDNASKVSADGTSKASENSDSSMSKVGDSSSTAKVDNSTKKRKKKKKMEKYQIDDGTDEPITLPKGVKLSKTTRYSRLANQPGILLVETIIDTNAPQQDAGDADGAPRPRKPRSDKGKKRGKYNKGAQPSVDPFEELASQYMKAYTSQKETELDHAGVDDQEFSEEGVDKEGGVGVGRGMEERGGEEEMEMTRDGIERVGEGGREEVSHAQNRRRNVKEREGNDDGSGRRNFGDERKQENIFRSEHIPSGPNQTILATELAAARNFASPTPAKPSYSAESPSPEQTIQYYWKNVKGRSAYPYEKSDMGESSWSVFQERDRNRTETPGVNYSRAENRSDSRTETQRNQHESGSEIRMDTLQANHNRMETLCENSRVEMQRNQQGVETRMETLPTSHHRMETLCENSRVEMQRNQQGVETRMETLPQNQRRLETLCDGGSSRVETPQAHHHTMETLCDTNSSRVSTPQQRNPQSRCDSRSSWSGDYNMVEDLRDFSTKTNSRLNVEHVNVAREGVIRDTTARPDSRSEHFGSSDGRHSVLSDNNGSLLQPPHRTRDNNGSHLQQPHRAPHPEIHDPESFMKSMLANRLDSGSGSSVGLAQQEADFYLRGNVWDRLDPHATNSGGSSNVIGRQESPFDFHRDAGRRDGASLQHRDLEMEMHRGLVDARDLEQREMVNRGEQHREMISRDLEQQHREMVSRDMTLHRNVGSRDTQQHRDVQQHREIQQRDIQHRDIQHREIANREMEQHREMVNREMEQHREMVNREMANREMVNRELANRETANRCSPAASQSPASDFTSSDLYDSKNMYDNKNMYDFTRNMMSHFQSGVGVGMGMGIPGQAGMWETGRAPWANWPYNMYNMHSLARQGQTSQFDPSLHSHSPSPHDPWKMHH